MLNEIMKLAMQDKDTVSLLAKYFKKPEGSVESDDVRQFMMMTQPAWLANEDPEMVATYLKYYLFNLAAFEIMHHKFDQDGLIAKVLTASYTLKDAQLVYRVVNNGNPRHTLSLKFSREPFTFSVWFILATLQFDEFLFHYNNTNKPMEQFPIRIRCTRSGSTSADEIIHPIMNNIKSIMLEYLVNLEIKKQL